MGILGGRRRTARSAFSPWRSLRDLGRLLIWVGSRQRPAEATTTAPAARLAGGDRIAAMTRAAARLLAQHGLVSMVLVGLDDLKEVDEVFGRAAATHVRNAALARLRILAGAEGLVCRCGATQFAVLVPGLPGDRALAAANAAFGKARCIELDWRGHEVLVAAACSARTLTDAAMLEEVHEDLREELALPMSHRATVVEERPACSKPPRPAQVARAGGARRPLAAPEQPLGGYATIPATLPMGLS